MAVYPSQEELKRRLSYDPETGIFIWLIGRNKGKRAGAVQPVKYRAIGWKRGALLYEHRLAFLYMTGRLPKEVDHIDRNKANNVWANLRIGDRPGQAANTGLPRNNTSGYKGVRPTPYGKWSAKGKFKGIFVRLGIFDTPEEAHRAYKAHAKHTYGEFFNG